MSNLIKSFLFFLFSGTILAACSAQPAAPTVLANNPYAPQPSDVTMMRGDAEIVSTSVATAESLPIQLSVSIAYRLPTPCYQLRATIVQPDSQNRIQLAIYGVTPKDKPCTQMALLTPMETNIDLGSFPTGHYTVWVNGQQIGAFDAQ